jgi:uncharacterized protein YjiS (DUF1127 family)
MSSSTLESSISRAASAITGLWRAALASLAKRWIDQIRSEWQVRRGIDALMALDDRMLHDIGLTRGAVEYAARHGDLATRATNESCRRISPGVDNLEHCATDRMPSVRAERQTAVRAFLMAHGIFAACAIALRESHAKP